MIQAGDSTRYGFGVGLCLNKSLSDSESARSVGPDRVGILSVDHADTAPIPGNERHSTPDFRSIQLVLMHAIQ